MLSGRESRGIAGRGPATVTLGRRALSSDDDVQSDEPAGTATSVSETDRTNATRRRAQLVFLVAAGLLIAVGVVVGGLVLTRNRRENKTTLTPQSVAAGDAVPLASLDGQWSVIAGNDSWVGYSVGENLLSVPTPNVAEGKTPGVAGGFVMRDGKVIAVAINADMTKLKSDDPQRDETLTTRGLETIKFPSATFTLTSPIAIADATKAGQPITFTAKGDLAVHGVTKPVELSLQSQVIAGDPDTIEVVGDQQFTFADYGIEPPNIANFLAVQDHGTLKIHLRLGRTQTPGTTRPL